MGHELGIELALSFVFAFETGFNLALEKGAPASIAWAVVRQCSLMWTMSSRSPGLPANLSFHKSCPWPKSWMGRAGTVCMPMRPSSRLPVLLVSASFQVPRAGPDSGILTE